MRYTLPNGVDVELNEANHGKVTAELELDAVVAGDWDSFYDALSEAATGYPLLQDIQYTLIGVREGRLVFEITGDFTDVVEER
jgi:hypothetical protein